MYNGVKFNEENNFKSGSFPSNKKTGRGIVGFVIRTGLAKNAFQANVVIIIFALITFTVSIFLFITVSNNSESVTPQQLEQIRKLHSNR